METFSINDVVLVLKDKKVIGGGSIVKIIMDRFTTQYVVENVKGWVKKEEMVKVNLPSSKDQPNERA